VMVVTVAVFVEERRGGTPVPRCDSRGATLRHITVRESAARVCARALPKKPLCVMHRILYGKVVLSTT